MGAARCTADTPQQTKTPIPHPRASRGEVWQSESLKDEDREIIDALLRQTRRLTALVEDLLLLAQVDAGRLKLEPVVLDLIPCIDVLADDLEALGDDQHLTVERKTPAQVIAKADARRVKIVL